MPVHVQSDGNGGINISKGALAFMTVFLVVISATVSIVAYAAGMRSELTQLRTDFQSHIDTTNRLNEKLSSRVDLMEKSELAGSVKIERLELDVAEAKTDIKYIKTIIK